LRFNTLRETLNFEKSYFIASLIGYFAGLLGTILVYRFYNSAQPALLQINAFILLFVFCLTVKKKEWKNLLMFDEDRLIEES